MRIVLYLLLAIALLQSCAARKVAASKVVSEQKTDSVSVEKKDSVAVQQNAIKIKEDVYEMVVTPIDSTKPIVIGDVEYKNASVKIRKAKKVTVDSTTIVVAQSTDKKIEVQKEAKSKVVEKKVDKKSNYFVYFWLLLLLILALIAYKLRRLIFIR
jgi:hypothetical protein